MPARIRTSVLIDEPDHRRLAALAAKNDRSLMAEVRVAIRKYLNGKGTK